jgi:hypothetical protein
MQEVLIWIWFIEIGIILVIPQIIFFIRGEPRFGSLRIFIFHPKDIICFLPYWILAFISIFFLFYVYINNIQGIEILVLLTLINISAITYLSFRLKKFLNERDEREKGEIGCNKSPCPYCNHNISIESQICPHCGKQLKETTT